MRKLSNLIKRLLHSWLFTYDMDIRLLDGVSNVPIRTYKNDAGYDLMVTRSVKVGAEEMATVNTGIAAKSNGVPLWLLLISRSSTLLKHGLIVDMAVIDDGYTGELKLKVYNTTSETVYLHPKMRIGQAIPMIHTHLNFRTVNEFTIKRGERGDRGFGSTGI